MINCNNGVVKIEGQHKDILADILCVLGAITNLMENDEVMRQGVAYLGTDETLAFTRVISQAIKEVEKCTEN